MSLSVMTKKRKACSKHFNSQMTAYQFDIFMRKTLIFRFFPLQKIVDVTYKPLKDVNFLQLKAALKGNIACLPDKDSKGECSQTQVTLKTIDGAVESKSVKAKGNSLFSIFCLLNQVTQNTFVKYCLCRW